MAEIVYALAGEGRGHATRARTVAGRLVERGHRVTFLTGADGLSFLRECFEGDERFRFVEIPVLRFAYAKTATGEKVNLPGTFAGAMGFLRRLRGEVRRVEGELRAMGVEPELTITDYEPMAWRVARRFGSRIVSLDSQHFFVGARMRALPKKLWPHAIAVRATCLMFCPTRDCAVVAKFVPPEIFRPSKNILPIGALVRPEIAEAEVPDQPEDFLLAYLRPSIERGTLKALGESGMRARVYGLGERPAEGKVEFRAVSSEAFASDLLRCRGLVGTAGNQMIGEALYLRKPLLLYPEPGQMEQWLNAELARGFGAVVTEGDDVGAAMKRFLAFEPTRPPEAQGDPAMRAVEILEGCLGMGK